MEYTDYKSEEMTESVRPEENSLFNNIQKEQMSKACNYLYSISKWMKFFFVLTIIGIVFMFVAGLIFLIASPFFDAMDTTGFSSIAPRFAGVIYLVVAGLYVPMAIYIKRIFTAAETAALSNDNDAMVEYLKNNKSLCKFCGILTIVMIGFSILVMPIIMMITALAA